MISEFVDPSVACKPPSTSQVSAGRLYPNVELQVPQRQELPKTTWWLKHPFETYAGHIWIISPSRAQTVKI